MYAIAFDLIISDLKKYYGEPYHNVYSEIKKVLLQNNNNTSPKRLPRATQKNIFQKTKYLVNTIFSQNARQCVTKKSTSIDCLIKPDL